MSSSKLKWPFTIGKLSQEQKNSSKVCDDFFKGIDLHGLITFLRRRNLHILINLLCLFSIMKG